MNNLFSQPIDGNCLLAGLVFAGHIAGNLWIAQGSAGQFTRFQGLSLFPPGWVFSIWLPIWTLQAVLLYQSYGSGFWTVSITGLFILICVGNVGSQFAGFQNLSWVVYLGFIACMFVSSVFFLKAGEQNAVSVPVFNAAAQLYVGWASIALVVGMGVILVCDQQLIRDAIYSRAGLLLLGLVPIALWTLWGRGMADYRVITLPYLLVLLALGIRAVNAGGQFLRTL